MHLLKMLQTGKIDVDNYEFNIKDNLTVEQQLVLLFEIRYKNELKAAGLKIQELMGKGIDFKSTIWNDHCQVSLINAAKFYIAYYAVKNFHDILNGKPFAFTNRTLRDLSP